MATIGDGFKDIFLAGIGAMAITAEKSKDLVDQLISRGELTVDQGKQLNSELKHKAEDVAGTVREDILEATMAAMSPEDRAAFAAKAAEIAARPSANVEVGDASAVEATEHAEAQPAEAPAQPQQPATENPDGETPEAAPQTPGA